MLLREEYIAALTHEDFIVRSVGLDLLIQCRAGDLDASRQAIRSLETYGVQDAFYNFKSLSALPLDEENAERLMAFCATNEAQSPGEGLPENLIYWLLHKPPLAFVRDHCGEIHSIAASCLDYFSEKEIDRQIAEREGFDSIPHSELLARLDRFPVDCSAFVEDYPFSLVDEASRLIKSLCAIPDLRPTLESRATAWIALPISENAPEPAAGEPPIVDNYWLVFFGLVLAGNLGLVQTIPQLLKLLEENPADIYETVQETLEEMNSLETLRIWEPHFSSLSWDSRVCLTSCCERISEPGVEDLIERLLQSETDSLIQIFLVTALSVQPSDRATSRCVEFYREHEREEETYRIAENLYARHKLLGRDHPDLDRWRTHCERHRDEMISMMTFKPTFADDENDEDFDDAPLLGRDGFPPYDTQPREPYIAPPKHNRNDPCPCGSGKKYKKCCLAS